jgi:PDZ domain-containing protein
MNEKQSPIRLHSHMAAMLALEQAIGQRIEHLLSQVTHNSEAVALLKDLQKLTANHRPALAARLQVVAPDVPIPETTPMAAFLEGVYDGVTYPASAALVSLYTLFHQAIIGYTVLMVLTRRFADSSVRSEDNTDDLVQQHLRNVTVAVQQVVRGLPGVVVAELEQAGQECQCTCPACGLGICLCAVSTRRALGMAWTDAGPVYMPEGIVVVHPRSGSGAAKAGFQKGNVVVAVDGKAIESLPMLQETIGNHGSGEEIDFQVQQSSGESVDIRAVRP